MQRARRSVPVSRSDGLRGAIPTLLVWPGSVSARACTISFRRAREHNTAMSRERGAQAGGGPAWIARLVWGLVLAGFLIHFVPGLGLGSGASGPGGPFVIIAFAL